MNYLQRKKLAFMSIVNSVKGFVRNIIGVPPLTLSNCVDDKSLIDCKIYGNSVQEGKNLLQYDIKTISSNGVTWTVNDDRSITATGTPSAFSSFSLLDGAVDSKWLGKTMIFYNTAIDRSNCGPVLNFFDIDNNRISGDRFNRILLPDLIHTFTVPENAVKITCNIQRSATSVECKGTFYPMLLLGEYTEETLPEFAKTFPAPDNPMEIGSVGEKTKNLFDCSQASVLKRISSTTVGFENSKLIVNKTSSEAMERIVITIPTPKANTNISVSITGDVINTYGIYMSDTIPTEYTAATDKILNTGESPYINISISIGTSATGELAYYILLNLLEGDKNIFDVNNPYLIGGYLGGDKLMSYTTTVDTSSTVTLVLSVNPNTIYTVSRILLGKRFALGTSPNAPAANIAMTNYATGSNYYNKESITINSGENDKYLYVWFYNSQHDTYTYQELMEGISVVKVSAAGYEPFGYKIPVIARGKNLFEVGVPNNYYNPNSISLTINKNSVTGSVGSGASSYIYNTTYNYKSGKYCFSHSDGKTMRFLVRCYDEEGIQLTNANVAVNNMSYNSYYKGWFIGTTTSASVTIPDTVSFWQFGFVFVGGAVSEKCTYTNIQIEEGDTTTSYEPFVEPITINIYAKEPIRKIFNTLDAYADVVDLANKKIIRNITSVNPEGILWRGTADGKNGVYATQSYNLLTPAIDSGGTINCFCKNFTPIPRNSMYNTGCQGISASGNRIRLYHIGLTDLPDADFRAWVNENPMQVDYILAEPIEEPIDLPNLPTFKGTTIYEIGTTIQPSNMEVTYYSTQKE